MSGNTKLQEFNQFFVSNYKYLLGFAKSIDGKNDYESLLHDCFLKAHNRISMSGYSGSTYLNYMRCTIMNSYKTSYRDRKYTIDIEHPDFIETIEEKLLENYEYEQQRKDYDNEMSFLNTMAFEYVNKYFSQKDQMIFKTYYVLKHKHLNYKQLAIATNLSQTSVSNCIKNIKKDLRQNLLSYINTGYRIMELQELLLKVEQVLKTDHRANKRNYMDLYFQVYGKHWNGCGCNTAPLQQALKVWYVKNNNINKN